MRAKPISPFDRNRQKPKSITAIASACSVCSIPRLAIPAMLVAKGRTNARKTATAPVLHSSIQRPSNQPSVSRPARFHARGKSR